ncbi:MAG: TetR/AcrR family transcriptional regulator [Acidimicrobiia bacterium]
MVTTTAPPEVSDPRSRLVSSAAELIHAGSYRAVGVKAICEKAGVKKGSFYYFFPSKEALVLDALDSIWEEFERDGLRASFDPGLAPRQRIEAMFDHAYQTHSRIRRRTGHVLGCPFGNLAAEASTLNEPIRDRVLMAFAEWTALIEETIEEALRAGELDPALSAEATAWSLLGTLQGALLLSKAANDTGCIRVIGRETVEALWGGAVA